MTTNFWPTGGAAKGSLQMALHPDMDNAKKMNPVFITFSSADLTHTIPSPPSPLRPIQRRISDVECKNVRIPIKNK
jgi:hypothetical protein